jgi:mutator protein MutT
MESKIFPVAIGLLKNDKGEILIQLRNDPTNDSHNKWALPGGIVDENESPEEAVVREVKEETGFEVEVVRLLPKLFRSAWSHGCFLLIPYECRIIGGEYSKQDFEVIEGKFVLPDEIDHSQTLLYTKEIVDLLKK